MTHLSFPRTCKAGEIFYNYLYNYSTFESTYRHEAKSIETHYQDGKSFDSLILKKNIWGVTQRLFILDRISNSVKHRGISFLVTDPEDFNLMTYFIDQRISVGEYSVIERQGRNINALHEPIDPQLSYAKGINIDLSMEHSQRYNMSLIVELK